MTRTSKRQQDPKSCGAATLLVALHELTGEPAKTTNAEEKSIYNAVKFGGFGPKNLGKDETLPASLHAYAVGEGLKAEIVENPDTAKEFGTKGMYVLYSSTCKGARLSPSKRELEDVELANDARLFLVMKFPTSDLTHYVLARRDGGQVYIMNPDPGSDEQMPLPGFNKPLTTNSAGTWCYDDTTKGNVLDGHTRDYVFTGIFVRVWK